MCAPKHTHTSSRPWNAVSLQFLSALLRPVLHNSLSPRRLGAQSCIFPVTIYGCIIGGLLNYELWPPIIRLLFVAWKMRDVSCT